MRAEPKEAGDLSATGTLGTHPSQPAKRESLLVEALLWFVWFPTILILLIFVLERFVLSETWF
jgi:hypothetical protein